jgi:flagellar biosynthetic protein FlhB
MQKMRMTKYELKKEFKEQEGSQEVKAKIRQIAQEKLKSRLSEVVPSASFVVTNPEHYAVALSYMPESEGPPVVVAKGVDEIAQIIKQIARESRVPVMEYPRVARKLYAECEVGQDIPEVFYEDIAEIIRYIARLDLEFAKKYKL